jgi:hypothetical protein
MVGFMDVREALIRGCRVPSGLDTFLSLAGAQSGKISLTGNDLLHTAKVVEINPEVDATAVRMVGNLQVE